MKKNLESFYPFLVFLVAFLLYANTISHSYNLDDELVTMNHRTTSKGFSGIKEIFTSYYYEDDMGYKYDYRPITHLSFALEHQLFKESARTSHLINVLLYAFICLLIYYFALCILPNAPPVLALLAALIFAVHPIHTEVVASIKNRDEILSLLFAVSSFIVMLKVKEQNSNWRFILRISLAVLFFTLSVYSKLSTLLFLIWIPSYFLITKSFRLKDLVFVFFGSMLLFANFNLEFKWILLISVLLCLVLALVYYLLFHFDFRKFTESFSPDLLGNKQKYFILSLAYLVFTFAIIFSHTFLYLLAISLATWFLYLSVKKNANNFRFFALIYPIILLISYTYNYDFLAFPFFLLFVYFYPDTRRKESLYELIFFAIAGLFNLIQGGVMLYAAMVPLLLMFFPKHKYKAIVIWTFFASFLVVEDWYLMLTFLLLACSFWIQVSKANYIPKFQSRYLITSLLISALYFQFFFKANYDSPRMESLDFNLDITENTYQLREDIDRPIVYSENPLVENWDYSHRLGMGFATIKFYLQKFILPYPLSFYYGYNMFPMSEWKDTPILVLAALLLISLLISIYFAFKRHVWPFAYWFMLGNLLPYSNLITPVAGIVGERLSFTASLGYALLLALFFRQISQFRKLAVALFIALFITASFYTIKRNSNWKNEFTLFSHDIEHLTNSATANAIYADECMVQASKSQNPVEIQNFTSLGEKHYLRAIEIYPKFLNWWLDLGKVYRIKGDLEKAKSAFQKSLDFDANYSPIYYNLTEIAIYQQDQAGIIENLKQLHRVNPNDLSIMFDLSSWYYEFGMFQNVLELNDEIIAMNNTLPEAYLNKAYAFSAMKDWDGFSNAMLIAEKLNSQHPDFLKLKEAYAPFFIKN
ncbi:MAG: hypothetical protein H6579_00105 [Chitinophagales bacterium]|nr:hypothetical protein [Chitinophagales bacterium]